GVRGQGGDFRGRGDSFTIVLEGEPKAPLSPGASFYYGPNPNGIGIAVPAFPHFEGNPADDRDLFSGETPGAVIVTESAGTTLTVRNIGSDPVDVDRPPQAGDYVFLTPTQTNPAALAAWALVPNMHFFWLVDAVSQNRPVPVRHLGMLTLYAAAQIGTFLSIGVLLFQKRDVG